MDVWGKGEVFLGVGGSIQCSAGAGAGQNIGKRAGTSGARLWKGRRCRLKAELQTDRPELAASTEY